MKTNNKNTSHSHCGGSLVVSDDPNQSPTPMRIHRDAIAAMALPGFGNEDIPGAIGETEEDKVGDNPGGAKKSSRDVADENKSSKDIRAIATLMMFNQQPAAELSELKKGQWPHDGSNTPDPITIATAHKPLAAGHAKTPCEVPGA